MPSTPAATATLEPQAAAPEAPEPPVAAAPSRPGVGTPLLVTLGVLAAFAPFALDMYLPAFPEMTASLGTTPAGVQLSLTAFLLGLAAGQLVFGPASDRLGRRGPLLVGMAVLVASSVVAAVAPSVAVLVVARLVQGLSGAAGQVIGRAVVADLARGREAAKAFSLMMIVGGVAPVVAPLAGSFLVGPLGWRGVLGVLAVIAAVMLAAATRVPESHPASRRAQSGRTGATAGFTNGRFLAYTGTFAFAFAALMAYISASPFVFQTLMGLGERQYGLVFGSGALALMAVSTVSARLARTVAPVRLLTVGIASLCCAALTLGGLVVAGTSPGWYAAPLFVAVASLGLVMGNATALALSAVPHSAGRASAVLGAAQFSLGGVASVLVGLGGGTSAVPLAAVLVGASLLSAAFLVAARSATR